MVAAAHQPSETESWVMRSGSLLILEDEFLIAADMEESLHSAGFINLHIFSRCNEAEQWLAGNRPDLAILDIYIGKGDCTSTALILSERSIPFVVHSAARREEDLYEVLLNAPWFDKPADTEALVAAVMERLQSGNI